MRRPRAEKVHQSCRCGWRMKKPSLPLQMPAMTGRWFSVQTLWWMSIDTLLGKPVNGEDAVRMLLQLSGRIHRVCTVVSVASRESSASRLSETRVRFREITDSEAHAYWNTGEPKGKAGGYAIQGRGAVFVESISGSYSGVMGLPLFETAALLAEFGVPLWLSPAAVGEKDDAQS